MRIRSLALVAVMSVVAVGQSSGTVTFVVTGNDGLTTVESTISLSVSKAGKKDIVTPPPPPTGNQFSGTHTFPRGTGSSLIAQYYRLLLNNAGWTEGTDFTVGNEGLNFFGISKLDGTSGKQVDVSTKFTAGMLAYAADPPAMRIRFDRAAGTGQIGSVTILAFGIKWDEAAKQVRTIVGEVHVRFKAADSAAQVTEKIRSKMIENGWNASLADGALTVASSGDGAKVYSIWLSPVYDGEGSNQDNWTIEEVR